MEEGAVREDLKRDKYMMGHVRSQLTPELKMFIDLSKPQTAAQFESLVEQWSMLLPSKRAVVINKTNEQTKHVRVRVAQHRQETNHMLPRDT